MMTPIASEDGARLRGRWFRLRYSQSLLGQPSRIVARLVRETGTEEHALAGAGLGRGLWTWRAPRDLLRLEILAPAERAAAIRVDAIDAIGTGAVLGAVMRRDPRLIEHFVWPGAPERARQVAAHEAFDLCGPDDFARFAREHRRPLEPDALDADLFAAAAAGPTLGFVMALRSDADLAGLDATLAAFARQRDGGFRLLVLAPPGVEGRLDRAGLGDRLTIAAATAPDDHATLLAAPGMGADYVAPLLPGDEPAEEAVPCLRAHLALHPDLDVLYADGARRVAGGRIRAELKPDWSPAFQGAADYIGRPCLVRAGLVANRLHWRDLPGAVAEAGGARIGHLRRVLMTLPSAPGAPPPPERPAPARLLGDLPRATVVVPTRDRVDLLRRLCESLAARTPAGSFDLVVVDNGSEDPAALAYLRSLEERSDTRLLRRPGPFNFAALVNAGVEAATGEVVVLLNNDCEIVAQDWLARLVAWAIAPGIGAVGAKLLYGDGTLQHAGVAMGLGGQAGHRDRRMPGDHPGMLGRLAVPHEVAAVTAACLAVSRATYREAGGFDEAFPVAFNDIDFCLRLLGRGDRNILEPRAVVVHAESASRGRDDGIRRARFLREAALFRERWGDLILDDPWFHPMLSTFRFQDRLG